MLKSIISFLKFVVIYIALLLLLLVSLTCVFGEDSCRIGLSGDPIYSNYEGETTQ